MRNILDTLLSKFFPFPTIEPYYIGLLGRPKPKVNA